MHNTDLPEKFEICTQSSTVQGTKGNVKGDESPRLEPTTPKRSCGGAEAPGVHGHQSLQGKLPARGYSKTPGNVFFLPASTTSSDLHPNSHIFSQTLVHLIYGQCRARTRGLSIWALSINSCVTWARTVAPTRLLASIPHPKNEMRLEQMIFKVLPRPAPHSLFLHRLCCCCSSVAQSCPTLCDPVDCSTGFPVLHHLPELVQTHAH